MNLAEIIAVTQMRIRGIVETILPPKPCPTFQCGEKDCTNKAVFLLKDASIHMQVYVCLDHYMEVRNYREWEIEPT